MVTNIHSLKTPEWQGSCALSSPLYLRTESMRLSSLSADRNDGDKIMVNTLYLDTREMYIPYISIPHFSCYFVVTINCAKSLYIPCNASHKLTRLLIESALWHPGKSASCMDRLCHTWPTQPQWPAAPIGHLGIFSVFFFLSLPSFGFWIFRVRSALSLVHRII